MPAVIPIINYTDNFLLAVREAGGLMFFYPGEPRWRYSAKYEPRFAGRENMARRARVKAYAEGLGWCAKSAARANGPAWEKRHIPMQGGIALGITVYRKARATSKPDLDNYLKLVSDALTLARIYTDDAQVTEFFPGSRKVESPTEGMRVIVVPDVAVKLLSVKEVLFEP